MANWFCRKLWAAVFCASLTACGGIEGENPVTSITATNFQYGQMATITLTGNGLDNAIRVTSDKCSVLSLAEATSTQTRQALCMVSGTGPAFFTVRSSAGYVVYTTTLNIPEPVTGISASNLGFGQEATITLTGHPQNSAIALRADKCINIRLSPVNTSATRTATCNVVGTGPVTFSITHSTGSGTLYSTTLNSSDPTGLSTFNNKYSQKTYIAFPTQGRTDLQLTSTGCENVVMDSGSHAAARSASCTLSKTGTVRFDVKQADTTVMQTSIEVPQPRVAFTTSLGEFVMELNPTAAPITVNNFLAYVNRSPSFYNGTIFHRVIPGFVVQGGGFNPGMVSKSGLSPAIKLESDNGLTNDRGTVAMARIGPAPGAPETDATRNSATSQFFVNLVNNTSLNYSSSAAPGYAVFGRVVSGMNVIDSIAAKETGSTNGHSNVPKTDITVTSATQTQ